uniref:Uncharacterized protein n=1 Tax=Tetranychus urticae TaxID=32264 RepID=T1KGJ5_TETUR
MVKFCIDCTAQAGSQCILSRNSSKYLWIVFSCKSDAQDCLSKVQIMYPDAIISDPPVDLALSCLEDPYFVESCEEIDENEVPEHNDAVNFDVSDGTDWKMFFRYNSNFIAPMPYYEPTRWSLLYNLFEKLYDLGAKKVIFDGNLYCAHFESDSDYQEAFENLRSRHLEPLESVDAPETRQQKVTMKMNRYSGIPWCLNEHLDLYCLVIKVKSQLHDHFMDIGKYILGNRECIFIKSTPGEIWIGFPDELICENSMKTVDGFIASLKQSSNASMAKPSNKLLESIKFHDLAGDAYDLAFLSSQLEGLKTTPRPQIIERIRMQRMQEQECNESYVSYFTAHGTYDNRWTDYGFPSEQLVKVLVKFSKVIPLAVTVSYEEVYLMYNSWHEAYVASIFIENLRNNEVPYLAAFTGAGVVEQHQIDLRKTSEYYIINDKRKVLDKIVQNKSLVDQSDSDSSTVQSTTDIDVLDEEMKMKLKYSFVITTESDFKFTSGMITIIKMNLVQMGCPVCVDFEDKVWVTVDDLEKGNKAKAKIEKIKFKMLHEYEDDFEVGVVMESLQTILTKVGKMLVNKMMNPKRRARNVYLTSDVFPLGHFNYSYRKAIGMSTSRYCQLTGSFK